MGCCHHKEQDLPLCSLIRALMCTMEDVPTAAPAVHNVKDTMEDAPINTDMSRSPFCPPSSPIDVVPIVAVEFFMAAPNSQGEGSSHLSLPFIYVLCCESSLTYQVARIPVIFSHVRYLPGCRQPHCCQRQLCSPPIHSPNRRILSLQRVSYP